MSDPLRPQTIQDPKSLSWWHKDIKELNDSLFRDSKYRQFFIPLTSEQSKLAWQKLSNAIDETDPRGLKPIVMSGVSALMYFYGSDKRNELKTQKDREKHAQEIRNKFDKVAKDLLSINRAYKQNLGYFQDHDHNLDNLNKEVTRISKSINSVRLDAMLTGRKTKLSGVVYLARNLEKIIRDLTGSPHYREISILISAVFDDPDGDFSPRKISDWCKSGKNYT